MFCNQCFPFCNQCLNFDMLFFCLAVQFFFVFFSPLLFNFYFVHVLKMSKRNKNIKRNCVF